jgi:hypothetical protein
MIEQPLSEKIREYEAGSDTNIYTGDVKQSIQEFLKETREYHEKKKKLCLDCDCMNNEEKGIQIRCIIDEQIWIDSLAKQKFGDKLI